MADLVLSGLRSHLKEKLEGFDFLTVGKVLQRALAHESRANESKETHRMSQSRINLVGNDSDLDDEADVYATEFVWPSKAKPHVYDDLKPIRKNRNEDFKCSFGVGKCDKIFDALLKDIIIKLSHVIPPADELRPQAYCKYHHSYSHATNDFNVFRRQIQSPINEGRLSFVGMAIDQQLFPMNALDLQGKKVLIRPEAAESANKDNVVIGEPMNSKEKDMTLAREIVLSRKPDGKETIKITIKNPTLRGQQPEEQRSPLRFIKPKSLEIRRWKTNNFESRSKAENIQPRRVQPTYNMLF
jgi:hypothetical protein